MPNQLFRSDEDKSGGSPKLRVEKSHLRRSLHLLPPRWPAHILAQRIVILCHLLPPKFFAWKLKDAECSYEADDNADGGAGEDINGVVAVVWDPGEGGEGGEEEGEKLEPGSEQQGVARRDSSAHVHLDGGHDGDAVHDDEVDDTNHDKNGSKAWKLCVAGRERLHGIV